MASWFSCAANIPEASTAQRRCSPSREIYRDDLDDGKQAKATFEDFLKHYPGNSHAQEARKAIAEIDNPSAAKSPFKAKAPKRERPTRPRTLRAAEVAPKGPKMRAKAPADDELPRAGASPSSRMSPP